MGEQQSKSRKNIFQEKPNYKGYTLQFQVIASATLNPGDILATINKEDIYYFGNLLKDNNGKMVNHYKIPCIDKKLVKRGRHFYVRKENDRFFIKDLGIGDGCFRQIDEIKLRTGMLINIGQIYFQVETFYEPISQIKDKIKDKIKEYFIGGYPTDKDKFIQQTNHHSTLKISFYGEDSKNYKYTISSQNYIPITIGRSLDCLIRFDDILLCKYQCTIKYDGYWLLYDGIDGKQSSNGTYVYIDQECQILNNMRIKTNNTILEASYI